LDKLNGKKQSTGRFFPFLLRIWREELSPAAKQQGCGVIQEELRGQRKL
jgi:hypothetical protein